MEPISQEDRQVRLPLLDAEQLIAEKNLRVKVVMGTIEKLTNYDDLGPDAHNTVRNTVRYHFHHLLNTLLVAAGHQPKELSRGTSSQRHTIHT